MATIVVGAAVASAVVVRAGMVPAVVVGTGVLWLGLGWYRLL